MPATEQRLRAAREYRQQKRREGLSPGEADRATLEAFPGITHDELNPGHGKNWLDKVGDAVGDAVGFVGNLFSGGPDLSGPKPGMGMPTSPSMAMPEPHMSAFRTAQPLGTGAPFTPVSPAMPGGPASMGMGVPGTATVPGVQAPGMGDAIRMALGVAPEPEPQRRTTATPTDIDTGTAPPPPRGMSALEWAAIISELLGTGFNVYAGIQEGRRRDREERERRRARDALLPLYIDLLRRPEAA